MLTVDRYGEARDLLLAGANVSLHAGPGMGKSFMSDRLHQEFTAEHDVLTLRADLSTSADGRQVLVDLWLGFRAPESRVGSLRADVSLHEAWVMLSDELARSSRRTVLFLDGFDSVTRFPDGADFLRHLRELVCGRAGQKCGALLVSRRPVRLLEEEVRGISTLADVCYSLFVWVVQPEEVRSRWPDVTLSDGDMRNLLEWSGGLPSLITYWLVRRPAPGEGSHDLAVSVQRANAVDRQLDYLASLGLLSTLAQEVLGPAFDAPVTERSRLASAGIIPHRAGDGGERDYRVLSDMDLFADRLRLRTRDLSPWGVFGLAEKRLRELIDATMTEALGLGWEDRLAAQQRSFRPILEAAREKQKVDEIKYGTHVSFLAYTYPRDLWDVISVRWTDFAKVFAAGDKRYWRERFEGLATYRTPLAHNREEVLSEAQRLQVRVWSEEIVRAVEAARSGS